MAVNSYIHDGSVLGAALAKQGTDVGALTQRIITAASITNTTGGAIQATVNFAPASGTGTSNTLISGRPIAAGETYPCPELIGQGVNAGGAVWAMGNGLSFKYAAKETTG